jgi:hypothetical protein
MSVAPSLERLTQEYAGARASGRDQRIAVAKFVADQSTASRADGVADNSRRTNARAAGEESAHEN